MASFNATQVGLERMASFYNDLPLGIDERQSAGKNQEGLEKLVYMIASGTGKVRGAKGGGLQVTHQWRTIALMTGEEPLSTSTTQTGVSTRVLEIYGGPFDKEREASEMHQQAPQNCGWAGPEFVKRLLHTREQSIVDKYEEMTLYVNSISEGKSGSHIAGIAAVALADAMIDTWLFRKPAEDVLGDSGGTGQAEGETAAGTPGAAEDDIRIDKDSWERAKQMAAAILQEQMSIEASDVNENAVQFIVDWILSNRAYFGEKAIGTCLGTLSESGNTAFIFPTMLNQALTKAGYSPAKTMKYMAEKGLIAVSGRENGEKGTRNTVVKRFSGRTCRFVEFRIGQLSEAVDLLDIDDEEGGKEEYIQQSFMDSRGFQKVDDGAELPFP